MNAAAQPEYPAALVAGVEKAFTSIDWDELVPDVLDKALDIEATTVALLVFAPHLGVIEGGDL
ncbi:hypothetical protein [Streptomyces sioyaensis]|uniref:hypothetical protein n=1 Tax=Streptomyces sioyaensis TaxID=67364 RepID=UPI0037A1E2C6